MRLVSLPPVKFAPLVSLVDPGKYRLTLIVKATYDLVPDGVAVLADEQIVPGGDVPFDDADDPQAAPRLETDFAPYKPHAELSLAGKCYTPEGKPLEQCQVTFQVGVYHKSLLVFGRRRWKYRLGVLPTITKLDPFSELELRYENSFGGPEDKRNPIGKGLTGVRSDSGEFVHDLPNIEHPSRPIRSLDDCPPPMGFGPLGREWEPRASKQGTYNKRWQQTRWPCLPEDFDWSFFNASPEDMQVDGYLRGDEELYFENLHPIHSQFRCRLPGRRMRCFVNEQEPDDSERERFRQIDMNLDTLSVDMEAEQVYLVWRGISDIRNFDYREIKTFFVHEEPLDEPEQPLEAYRRLFERHREIAEQGPLAGQKLPDVEEYANRVAAVAAAAVAARMDTERINRDLAEAFGDQSVTLPDLTGMSLDEQTDALDQFSDQMEAASQKFTENRQREMDEYMTAMGIDPAERRAAAEQEGMEQAREMLAASGVEDDLRELDVEIRQTAAELYRTGIDFDELGVDIAPLCGGLAGMGADPAKLGMDIGPADPALTAETVVAHVARGESLASTFLAKLDLSGRELSNGDFRDAILADTDLSGADLSGADLTGAVLARADFSGARLKGANLRGANLTKANLSGADLTGAVLDDAVAAEACFVKAKLDHGSANGARFLEADLSHATAHHAAFHEAHFFKATLNETDFQQADLFGVVFSEACGEKVRFTGANLTKVQALMGCQFPGGVFHQAQGPDSAWGKPNLAGADFSFANMRRALFDEANFERANLFAADLRNGRLGKSILRQARLVSANLYQTALDRTDLSEADLSEANAFEADFFEAEMEDAVFDNANLQQTILEG